MSVELTAPNAPTVRPTSSALTRANHWDHFLARWGVRRGQHRVTPGLYALGRPTPESPVFVSANYTLSFDALRSSLPGRDGWLLVLDTHGVNVWCAAGKSTFGTDELAARIELTRLAEVVTHRKLIVPQLGAPGVWAAEVRRRTGFRVEFGPVRARDLPRYLDSGATPDMRQVTFTLVERAVLIPMELVHTSLPMLAAAIVLTLTGGWWGGAAALAAVLGGAALFPILLPWLPGREFSVKGFVLGGAVALPFALHALLESPTGWGWRALSALPFAAAIPAVVAFLALNFTGSSTITSRTGVRREMSRYIRPMAATGGIGALALLASIVRRLVGGG